MVCISNLNLTKYVVAAKYLLRFLMVCSMFSRSNKHHRNRGFRSSSSVIGCEASYLHHGSSNFEDIKEEVAATGEMASASEARASHGATVDLSSTEPQGHHQHHQQTRLETHSCPSSPTETDCSSGFSTLRRRSVTVTEKVSYYRRKKGLSQRKALYVILILCFARSRPSF